MGIGLGIVLVVIGLILVLNVVQVDIGFVDDVALGWILLIVGILAIHHCGHPFDSPYDLLLRQNAVMQPVCDVLA